MPFRFRKSFEILPGVRVNINKKSVSVTGKAGPVRYTRSTSGRDTVSADLPGPLSYRKTIMRQRIAERRENIRRLRRGA